MTFAPRAMSFADTALRGKSGPTLLGSEVDIPLRSDVISRVAGPEKSAFDGMPNPHLGGASFVAARFVGKTPRRPQKLKAIDQEMEPRDRFSAREGTRKNKVFELDFPGARPGSFSARESCSKMVRAFDLDLEPASSECEKWKKSREKKVDTARLRTQVRAMQQHLGDVQAEMETTAKANRKAKASFEQLKGEHAILQASHTWVKSSLDAALSTADEYRRHYESVEASLEKADLDLARQEMLRQTAGQDEVSSAMRAAKAESFRGKQLEGELIMIVQTKQRTVWKLKDKAKAILECMAATRQTSMVNATFQHWTSAVQQERAEAEKAEQVIASQYLLRQLKEKRRHLTFAAAERVAVAVQSDLASMVLRCWAQQAQERSLVASVSPLRALVRRCDADGPWSAISSRVSTARTADALELQADASKQRRAKHGGKATSVVQHLADKEEAALLSQVLCCWSCQASNTKAECFREAEGQAKLAGLEALVQALRERLRIKTEELEDAHVAYEVTHRNNQEVHSACMEIMSLHTSVKDAFNEIQSLVDEE